MYLIDIYNWVVRGTATLNLAYAHILYSIRLSPLLRIEKSVCAWPAFKPTSFETWYLPLGQNTLHNTKYTLAVG